MICGTFQVFFWTTTFKSNVDKWLFDTKALFSPINLIIIVCCESIIFSEMKVALKSELLREDSGHSICCFLFFFHHLNIFHNQLIIIVSWIFVINLLFSFHRFFSSFHMTFCDLYGFMICFLHSYFLFPS